ncbi:hypothetical protein NQ317_013952 [Molorchus minor]|uniref:Integrase zinc-binding domain-containing protein n=1 Tax=Molorchus minor TaxID=1323400 RepID=A0ABQ9JWA7_9CUCU|nr:hypothetical protein NQ317_013952 [Molorchus minor]
MTAELKALVVKRGQVKGQLTRFSNFVNSCTAEKVLELQGRLDNLQTIWYDFNTIQSELEIQGEEPNTSLQERESFENSFYSTQAAAKQRIVDFQPVTNNLVFLWSDSTIVLSWLSAQPCRWKTFVSNRVSQIQQLTPSAHWRHVSSSDNPADIISRGIEPSELVNAQLWWQGPTWLSQNAEAWPETLGITLENEFSETRKANVSLVTRLSDYTTDRNKRDLSKLSNNEIEIAKLTLIKLAQSQEFGQELHNLERSQSVSHNSKLLSLNPFLDSDKIIRVGGRISNAPISYDRRHPIVLPEKPPLTKLIIKAEHHKQLHAGAQAILASLRLQYWPLNGKRAVRSVNYVQ